jgi:hypothetical protein
VGAGLPMMGLVSVGSRSKLVRQTIHVGEGSRKSGLLFT